ncbi:cystatin-like fold lipoprotein [Staphylococcus pseudintermedius]|uniref:cystatin-like fold lipoprotein n=1 Tax=Staphylococcus pseudintermedius TaxID=283734 RepID=UPI0036F40646
MKKTFILFISLIFVLAACGKKYDKEIEQVTKLEQKSVEDSQADNRKKVNRNSSDYKVYDNGNVITMTIVPFEDSDMTATRVYRLNKTNQKYEEDLSENVTEYQESNKPDYEENNLEK